ncbi:DUF3488 domain-containing protein [Candidatus Obscuribacterales bacterium]|nr:DUF3488 domain-containing protein [Candidatus Obscuribacterales bacterium]
MTDNQDREEIKKPGGVPASSSGDSLSGTESPVFGDVTGSSPAQSPQPSTNDDLDPAYEKTVIAKVPPTPNRAPASGLRPTQADTKAAENAKAAARMKPEDRRGMSAKNSAPVRPEDSIPLRLSTVMMVILLITGATVYVEMPPLAGFLLMWLAMIGTLLSYIYRAKRPGWVGIFPTIGAFLLLAYMVNVCFAQLNLGQINFLSTFTQVLAGLLALHCFDLRTRADFSINALIGLGLLVCTSGAANDLLFFICILGYITSVSLILYFDGVSRSRDVGPSRPIGEGRPASLPKPSRRQARAATSIILIPVLSLPLLTLLMFFFMPRSSSLINWILENGIRPYVAVSQSDRTRGYSAGAGTGSKPTKRGSGGTASGGVGGPAGKGGSGGPGGQGNPSQSVNPLDKRTAGKAPRGVGGGTPGQAAPYKEGVSSKNDEPQNVLPQSEATEDVVLRLTTPRPGYLRRVSFDTYDGTSWSRAEQLKEVEFSLLENQFPVGNANVFGVPRNCPIVEVPQHITVDQPLTSGTLPAMWAPQQIEGPFNTVAVQSDGTIKPDVKIEPGMTYFALSYVPVYRLGALTSQPIKTHSDFKTSLLLPPVVEMQAAEQALMDKYLQLPDELPARVKSKAKKIAGEGNWFVKAQRISEYLHNKKAFKYKSKNIYRVKGGDFVDNFLFKTKEGNCVDYASSFVIMARAAGIPARLVGGYLPGKYNQRTGFYEIKVKDGHAWAEIYMPNWSWIAFDPVPGGKLPETQKDENIFSKLADMGLANPFGGAFQGSSGAGLGHGITGSQMSKQLQAEKRKQENKPPIEEDDEFDLVKRLTKVRWEPIAITFILLGSAAIIVILLQRQRKKEYVAIPDDAKKSTLLFFQVVRDLRKYKIVRLPADTPLDLHARVLEGFETHRKEGKYVHPELEPLVSDFIEIYTLERFGRKEARIADLERMSEKIKKLVSANK